jgi:hypothetical protein
MVLHLQNPFVNLTAAGRLSGAIGFGRTKKAGENYSDLYRGATDERKAGIARVTDVFIAGVGDNAKGVKHPAAFPPMLVEQLIESTVGFAAMTLSKRLIQPPSSGVEKYTEI